MKYLNKFISLFSYTNHKQEFLEHKFTQNNVRILILSGFLIVEQVFYGLFVREFGSEIQKVHFFSAIIMLIYFLISLYYRYNSPKKVCLKHHLFAFSFILSGVLIAVYRSLAVEDNTFHLPTIFIAIIYGLAIVIHMHPFESFIIYLIANISLIYFLPIYNPAISHTSFIEDSIANCIISWIMAVINYRNFLRDFINQRIIEKNSLELSIKNKQIEEMNKNLKHMSTHDPLTGLFNRRKLNDTLHIVRNETMEKDSTFSVILLDIDKFKLINDTYGHKAGDDVLVGIGEILHYTVDPHFIVGRWGGEEFMVICPDTLLQEAIQLSENLRVSIQHHNFNFAIRATASFGISVYDKNISIEDIINKADEALYRAKNHGRNKVETAC